jgi:NTP pyrophosphatase (non-canonical NTP hydrolase)
MKEELGDVMRYIAIFCDATGITLEDAMKANIAKLQKRYPE